MKKIWILSCILIIFSALSSKAGQQDTLKLSAGFLFAPQAGISLQTPDSGFAGFAPLHLTILTSKGKATILAFYTVNSNSLGAGFSYKVGTKMGMYAVAVKSTRMKKGYTGVGITTPVRNGTASLFIEGGVGWPKKEPLAYIGLIIPFVTNLN